MQILTKITDIQTACRKLRMEKKTIALVPTMGFLHEGHLSLIRLAKKEADIVVVSRFVNPAQFAPGEDLDAYPTDILHDHKVTQEAGADLLFEPPTSSMYGEKHATWIDLPSMAQGLCGKTRPTHFRGVCTVVTKLFNIITPDVAVFGEKDWQQLTIIRRMVQELNMPVRIIGGALIREEDGLAMSSRNAYLTKGERALAPHIRKGLLLLEKNVLDGEIKSTTSTALTGIFEAYIAENMPMAKIDYISVVNPDSLEPVETLENKTIVAVAVYVGKARLLDNILLQSK
jgi:pantoate--beta-alanine ligase